MPVPRCGSAGSATGQVVRPIESEALRRVNANTIERVSKDRGKVVETATFALSPDGKVLTVKSDGTGQGVEFHNVQVFERIEE